MVDRDRVLVKLDELEGYLGELRSIAPASMEQFRQTEKKRACERLLQVAIECVIDVCGLIVRGKRLGLPADESDLFDKLLGAKIITVELRDVLRSMKGFRNILVHDYARIDDTVTFEMTRSRLDDFAEIRRQILAEL